jgi:hypothetical protein
VSLKFFSGGPFSTVASRADAAQCVSMEPRFSTCRLRAMLLDALKEGPAYGTLLVRRVAARTQGEIALHSARVYQALRAMEHDGDIEQCKPEGFLPLSSRRPPRYYRIASRSEPQTRPGPRPLDRPPLPALRDAPSRARPVATEPATRPEWPRTLRRTFDDAWDPRRGSP